MEHRLEAVPLAGIGEVGAGDDLARIIAAAAEGSAQIGAGDVLVVAQKVVSKAEGRLRSLEDYEPSERARELGERVERDSRLVEAVLRESSSIMRAERGVLIVRTHHGLVCANAGIDQSNLPEADTICLLPEDPDRSARELRHALGERLGDLPAVVISDSFGRPWRLGQAEVAIGCAGLAPLDDLRGTADARGRELVATVDAVADHAAGAAGLVRTKSGREAVVIVRGLERYVTADDGPGAAVIQRPLDEDLFA